MRTARLFQPHQNIAAGIGGYCCRSTIPLPAFNPCGLPQVFGKPQISNRPKNPVGVSLLAIAVGHLAMMWPVDRDREQAHSYKICVKSRISSNPELLQFLCENPDIQHPEEPCGSELAREGALSANLTLTDLPHSRASSLPQCRRSNSTIPPYGQFTHPTAHSRRHFHAARICHIRSKSGADSRQPNANRNEAAPCSNVCCVRCPY